jgi:hypothetical protein
MRHRAARILTGLATGALWLMSGCRADDEPADLAADAGADGAADSNPGADVVGEVPVDQLPDAGSVDATACLQGGGVSVVSPEQRAACAAQGRVVCVPRRIVACGRG